MPDTPVGQSPEPDPPPLDSGSKPLLSTARRRRSRSGKILVPFIMAIFGLGLFVLAVVVEPGEATDLPVPPFAHLGLSTSFPVAFVGYSVIPGPPGTTESEINISVVLATSSTRPLAGKPSAILTVEPPPGNSFRNCPPQVCKVIVTPFGLGPVASQKLAFAPVNDSGLTAAATFLVNGSSLGVATNGLTASVAIPDVTYQGPGTPIFGTEYHIPAANGYYWNSSPTTEVTNSSAFWEESLVNGDTPGRSAIGSNVASQVEYAFKAFLGGALVGIGGSGVFSAFQEGIDRLIPARKDER
jgi:hypothetical protein